MDMQPPVWGEDDVPDVEDAFGEHDIEYWVWSGKKLVPASPEQAALLREGEALLRLERWRSAHAGMPSATERVSEPRVLARLVRALRFRPALALPAVTRGRSVRPAGSAALEREADPAQTQRPVPKS